MEKLIGQNNYIQLQRNEWCKKKEEKQQQKGCGCAGGCFAGETHAAIFEETDDMLGNIVNTKARVLPWSLLHVSLHAIVRPLPPRGQKSLTFLS